MAAGSVKVITYTIWLASESELPFETWLKGLKSFNIVGDENPKDTDQEA